MCTKPSDAAVAKPINSVDSAFMGVVVPQIEDSAA
jgi:hypothetical protein